MEAQLVLICLKDDVNDKWSNEECKYQYSSKNKGVNRLCRQHHIRRFIVKIKNIL